MKVLWIYATVDATRTIVETGDTRTIDTEQGS
jgi:putative monooxygenase